MFEDIAVVGLDIAKRVLQVHAVSAEGDVPQMQQKRSRLWLNDGSCIRLGPERPNHVWSYDFVEGRMKPGPKTG